MRDLSGRVAIVTGVSRGVGRGVALGLDHAGASVFATGGLRDPVELTDVNGRLPRPLTLSDV